MGPLQMAVAQLLSGLVIVGACAMIWAIVYSWFDNNRQQKDAYYAPSRSRQSWDTDHEFFDMITEFQNDFA